MDTQMDTCSWHTASGQLSWVQNVNLNLRRVPGASYSVRWIHEWRNRLMAADLPRARTARLLLKMLPALVAMVPSLTGMVIAAPRRVDFETRVAAQAAIEQVY